ncbi:hypothetical protein FIBSPDRAFT_877199 [Athelia psychrophila]|uniref:Uncharacterized protein n=1 Tax=Athelia psychrophila TaxID=1759441 RepID=A0A167W5L4_9AGAM|nr:hypothetical protein FIBSPDRAFT_877199 [Fibularhizoctonia sp. CBS 109695]
MRHDFGRSRGPHPPAKRRPSELRFPRWNKTHRSNAHCSAWIALGRVEAWDIEESTLEIHTTGTDSESLKPDSVSYAPGPANTAALEAESSPAAHANLNLLPKNN